MLMVLVFYKISGFYCITDINCYITNCYLVILPPKQAGFLTPPPQPIMAMLKEHLHLLLKVQWEETIGSWPAMVMSLDNHAIPWTVYHLFQAVVLSHNKWTSKLDSTQATLHWCYIKNVKSLLLCYIKNINTLFLRNIWWWFIC